MKQKVIRPTFWDVVAPTHLGIIERIAKTNPVLRSITHIVITTTLQKSKMARVVAPVHLGITENNTAIGYCHYKTPRCNREYSHYMYAMPHVK